MANIVIVSNTDKIPKADTKIDDEEEEEEEEDGSEGIATVKPKIGVKFVVESQEINKTPLELELTTLQKPTQTSGTQNIADGLKNICFGEVPSLEKAQKSDQTLSDSAQQSDKTLEKINESSKSSESATKVVDQLAEKFVGEAMHKAYQDVGNTFTDQTVANQPINVPNFNKNQISKLPSDPNQQFHMHQNPQTQDQPQQPQQHSPIRVQLHHEMQQGVSEPQRPEWSSPPQFQSQQFDEHSKQALPQRPFAQKSSEKPISHQKLAEQVAHKALVNQQVQQTRPRYPKPAPAHPHSASDETQHGGVANGQAQQQPFGQIYYKDQQYQGQSPDQWYSSPQIPCSGTQTKQPSVAPESPPENTQLTWQQAKNPRAQKSDDPSGWVVQDSVSANQLVKGAPWARYNMEKQHRVWPPPPPKMCLVQKEEPAQYYASSGQEIFAPNREGEDPQWKPASGAPDSQVLGSNFRSQQEQWFAGGSTQPSPHKIAPPPHQPIATKPQAFASQPAAPFQANQSFDQNQHFQPIIESRSNPLPYHSQQNIVRQFGPVKPAIFNQYSTARYATPVMAAPQPRRSPQPGHRQLPLHQPLTLDTHTEGMHYQQERQSPRLIFKGEGHYNPEDITRAVPPSMPNTCTPVLPFTRQPDQQDYDKFHSQYSPVKMASGQYMAPESHQFVTNQVTCIPGGTSFARVQNVSQINFDPQTGQPFKENTTRVARTTRTVPKWH